MGTRSTKTLLFGLVLGSGFLIVGLGPSSAAAASKGISLTPFEQQLTIAPTDAAKTFDLVLSNHTASLQELDLTSRDFGSLNDSGGILLEGSNNYTQRYGLTSWLSLGTDTVVLQPGETRTVPVTIYNRTSLQPGGHYGAVVASVNSLNDQPGNHVVINQQLLSLILVDKTGGENYDLKLASISQNGNWLQLPNTVRLHFQNPGNVHVIPRGVVRLLSPSGTTLAQGIINDESAFILPESYRDIYVPLKTVGGAFPLPGLYHLQVEYRYEGISHVAIKRYNVSYVDLKLYVIVLILAGIGWWLYRRYKASGSRRP